MSEMEISFPGNTIASQYLDLMRAQAPRMFNGLIRSGELPEHLKSVHQQAHELMRQALANEPRDPDGHPLNQNAVRSARERVLAMLAEFNPEPSGNPEPPDDLPRPPTRTRSAETTR